MPPPKMSTLCSSSTKDLSIFKNFELPEKTTLQFRAEVYNIFNTPNFEPPNATISGWTEGPKHGYLCPIKVGDKFELLNGLSIRASRKPGRMASKVRHARVLPAAQRSHSRQRQHLHGGGPQSWLITTIFSR
jgi:hypothetical protein